MRKKVKKVKKIKRVTKRIVDNNSRWQGDYDTDTHVIRVNKKKSKKKGGYGGILDTIVHEELHAIHPKAWERTIDKKTIEKAKRLSFKQKRKLYSRYR